MATLLWPLWRVHLYIYYLILRAPALRALGRKYKPRGAPRSRPLGLRRRQRICACPYRLLAPALGRGWLAVQANPPRRSAVLVDGSMIDPSTLLYVACIPYPWPPKRAFWYKRPGP